MRRAAAEEEDAATRGRGKRVKASPKPETEAEYFPEKRNLVRRRLPRLPVSDACFASLRYAPIRLGGLIGLDSFWRCGPRGVFGCCFCGEIRSGRISPNDGNGG